MYTSIVQPSPSSASAAFPRLQTSYPPSAHSVCSPSALSPPSLASGCPSTPPNSFRVLQWNAGGLRARSTELLHFLSSHRVDLICIQESNLNRFSSFRIPGFSALRSDRTHSWSGILSPDATHASGGVVIFVRQGLSFSKLSTPSLSSLDSYSDYVGVNISLNNFSLSFFNVELFAIAYGENEFMSLQMKGLVWGTGQTLLRSPRGQNASRDVSSNWVGYIACNTL